MKDTEEDDFRNYWSEELQRCKDSPVYFYNNYVRSPGQKELTEPEYEVLAKSAERWRNRLRARRYGDYPLTPDQCYKPNDQ